MGTKNSYTGVGGKIGADISDGLNDWLDSLPGAPNEPAGSPPADSSDPPPAAGAASGSSRPSPTSPSGRALPAISLFRSSKGGGGSRSRARETSALTRTSAGYARSAGRGAAAAYAYRTGDAQTLRDLGLDYDALRANPNIFDVAHQIAQKVCEDLPPGTIETDEQLQVVGNLAEWLLEGTAAGADVTLGQIAEEAVALVLAEAYLVQTASQLNEKDMSGADRARFESDVRQACEELAAHANLAPTGPSPAEFTSAIENGLEYLHTVFGES